MLSKGHEGWTDVQEMQPLYNPNIIRNIYPIIL